MENLFAFYTTKSQRYKTEQGLRFSTSEHILFYWFTVAAAFGSEPRKWTSRFAQPLFQGRSLAGYFPKKHRKTCPNPVYEKNNVTQMVHWKLYDMEFVNPPHQWSRLAEGIWPYVVWTWGGQLWIGTVKRAHRPKLLTASVEISSVRSPANWDPIYAHKEKWEKLSLTNRTMDRSPGRMGASFCVRKSIIRYVHPKQQGYNTTTVRVC